MRNFVLYTLFFCLLTANSDGQQTRVLLPTSPQPFPVIKATPSGQKTNFSPDPLVDYRWETTNATDDLQVYALSPTSMQCDHKEAAKWNAKSFSTIQVTDACNLMFDFGRVSAGWLEFDSEDLTGEVEMSISEYNQPAVTNWMVKHSKKTTVPVKKGNTYRLELNDQLYEGVRFGWIHIRTFNRPFTIKNVRLICQVKPTNYEGRFSCSNEMLNTIWYTGAYTVKLNFLKDYFGAILMDRGDRYSWTGDAHISQYVSLLAFGNADFVKENLVRTAKDANGIASYSLYWVQSLIDYFNYTNDKTLFESFLDNACGKLDTACLNFGKNPSLGFYGWDERLGAGFETPNCIENQRAYTMLTIGTLRAFSEALRADEKFEMAAKYTNLANEQGEALRANREWFAPMGVHAAADAVNSGMPTFTEQNSMWKNAFSDRLQRISFSPFNEYFILKAMAAMNKYSEALTTLDDCWGGQIRNGATTTYEVYHPSWNTALAPNSPPVNMQFGFTSLTHPWSAGATRWLSEEILGIKPTSPGFKTFTFKPHLSAEVNWVEGAVPTSNGRIVASFNLHTGKGFIDIPAGTVASIALPKVGMKLSELKLNGKTIKASKEDADFVYYEGISDGKWRISVNYEGKPRVALMEKLSYAYTNNVVIDSLTSGHWIGKYGKNGYLLCDFEGKNQHRTKLPDFVEKVDVKCADNFRDWGTGLTTVDASDQRALASDVAADQKRSVGILNAITTTVEISSKSQQAYTVSLYFTDWKNENLSSVLEVFDLNTQKIVMPDYFFNNYQHGKYITLTLHQSVRIRIQRVRGENTSFGGLFFD